MIFGSACGDDTGILNLEPSLTIAEQSVGLTHQFSTKCGKLNGLGLSGPV